MNKQDINKLWNKRKNTLCKCGHKLKEHTKECYHKNNAGCSWCECGKFREVSK